MSGEKSKEKRAGDSTKMDLKTQRKNILRALAYLHPKNRVFELCVISSNGQRKQIAAGWFSDHKKAADCALRAGKECPEGIYVTVNPCKKELLDRADHQLKAIEHRTNDDEIASIKNIFIDVDAVRPPGVSATEAQLKAAVMLAKKIRRDFRKEGFPEPLAAMSGNGYHLIYKTSLKNNLGNRELVKRVLAALAQKYDNEKANIDQKVANPGRLVKLYGTMARKGKPKPDRPHRYASIMKGGDDPKPVRSEQLKKFAPETISKPTKDKPSAKSESGFLDVRCYLDHYGKKILDEKPHGSATLYVLERCIFNPEHGRKEAAIGQCEDGTLFYQCFHDSCKPRTWREARQEISGEESLSTFCTGKPKAAPNIRENFSIITALDIRETAREEVPVINGLLMEQENLEIVGPSGIGKSLMTLNIALNLGIPSTDKQLWAMFKMPVQCTTLFVQSENSLLGIKKRLGLIVKGDLRYEAALDQLIFPSINGDCRTSGSVADPHFQHFIKEMIYATNAKIVVVDPLISFHHANENDNAEMRRYLDTLTAISIETRTSLILIHHVGKAVSGAVGGGRGASAIGDWADNVLSLEPGKDNVLKVTHQKSRHFAKHPDFWLERTGNLDFKRVIPEVEEKSAIVKNALESLGGKAETQDLLAEKMVDLGCSSKSTAKRLIADAEEAGMVEKAPKGKAVGYQLVKAEQD